MPLRQKIKSARQNKVNENRLLVKPKPKFKPKPRPKKIQVLFVCTLNAYRSPQALRNFANFLRVRRLKSKFKLDSTCRGDPDYGDKVLSSDVIVLFKGDAEPLLHKFLSEIKEKPIILGGNRNLHSPEAHSSFEACRFLSEKIKSLLKIN